MNEKLHEVISSLKGEKSENGLRHTTLIVENGPEKFCVKKFNQDLKYFQYCDVSRYQLEKAVFNFLHEHELNVPKVLGSDDVNETLLLEYIEGKTLREALKTNPQNEKKYIRNTLDEVTKIHRISPQENIGNISFTTESLKHYEKYMTKVLEDLSKHVNADFLTDKIQTSIGKVFGELENTEISNDKYGHFELHQDNVIISPKGSYMIDYEKFHPHMPHFDVATLINANNISPKNHNEYIDYYKRLNPEIDNKGFELLLGFNNLVYNFTFMDYVMRNLSGIETRWVERNGERVKEKIQTDGSFGREWNERRGENIPKRIDKLTAIAMNKHPRIKDISTPIADIFMGVQRNEI